jgi:hypothetical protein
MKSGLHIYLLLSVLCLPIYGLSAPDLNQSGGFEHIRQTGYVAVANAGDDVWPKDGAYPFLSSAQVGFASSSSTNDAAAGTGCRTALVEGTDGDYNYQSETITFNGTTNVQLANTYLRMNRVKCVTVGSGGVNAGNLQVGTSSIALAFVPTSRGITQQSIYTVPAGKYAVLSFWDMSIASAGYLGGQVGLEMREQGKSWQTIDLATGTGASGVITKHAGNALKLPPKSDVRIRVIGADGSSGVNASMEIHQKR